MTRLFAHHEKDVRQYLRHDRKVLRFFAISELPYYPLGCKGEQRYVIHYYLSDDTLEVREVRSLEEPKGAGTFPKFLKRQKVPKGAAARPKSEFAHIILNRVALSDAERERKKNLFHLFMHDVEILK